MSSSRFLGFNILMTGTLYIAGFVVLGDAFPNADSSGEEIVEWFSAHGGRARGYVWTAAAYSLGLAIFGGQISALLPKPHRYIFLGGVLGFAITAQVQGWIWAGLALHPEGLSPGTARTLFKMALYWGPMVNGSTTAMAIPIVALGWGHAPLVPRGLAWLSILFFIEQAVETVTVFGPSTGFFAPGGTMNVYLGGAIGMLWVAVLVRWATQRLDQLALQGPATPHKSPD